MEFGNAIRDLMPAVLKDSSRKPGPVPPDFTTLAFLQSADAGSDDWPEADLCSVVLYLRGSRHLMLPASLKEAFPKHL